MNSLWMDKGIKIRQFDTEQEANDWVENPDEDVEIKSRPFVTSFGYMVKYKTKMIFYR